MRLAKLRSWTSNGLIWVYILITLFPIYWIVSMSLKPEGLITRLPPVFVFKPNINSYIQLLSGDFLPILLNSLVISFSTLTISLIVGTLAAYSIARYNTGGEWLTLVVLVVQMVPPMVITFPLFILIRRLGLIDTRLGVILAQLTYTLPFVIWTMKQFFGQIPIEIEEAARIDGASDTRTLFSIMLPIAMPGLVSASVFTFLRSWNDFLYPLILTIRKAQTVTVAASRFVTVQDVLWSQVGAISTLIIVPPILFTVLLRRRIVEGLVGDSVKG